jgi:hypothetical protein
MSLQDPVDLGIQAFKESDHIAMSLLSNHPGSLSMQGIDQAGEFDSELDSWAVPIGVDWPDGEGVLGDGGPEPLAGPAGEGKGPAYADGTHSIQFVGIIEYLGLQCLWGLVGAESVGGDDLGNGSGFLLVETPFQYNPPGSFRADQGVVYAAVDLLVAGDVVEKRSGFQDTHVGPFGWPNASHKG